MRRLLIAFCLATLTTAPAAAQVRIPADWLATVAVQNPAQVAEHVRQLLDTLGVQTPLVAGFQRLDTQRFRLGDGPFVVGLGAPDGSVQSLYAFASVPTPVAELQTLLGGEMVGETLLAEVPGYEVAARRIGQATLVVPIDHQNLFEDASLVSFAGGDGADAACSLSGAGLKLLESRVSARQENQSAWTRVGLNELRWPPSARWLDAAIGANEPLATHLAGTFRQMTAYATLDDQGGANLRVEGRFTAARSASSQSVQAAPLPVAGRPAIAHFSGDVTDGVLVTLSRLMLAYGEGRPDEIEVRQYDAAAYADMVEQATTAVALVQAVDAQLLDRSDDDPFYSNRIAMVRVADQQAFVEAVRESADHWNQLVAASKPRMALTIAIDEQQLADGLPPALRLTTDVGAALQTPTPPEVQEVMRKYYGPGGLYRLCVQPLADGRVLLADLPEEQLAALLQSRPVKSEGEPSPFGGTVRLGRYAAWKNAMLDDYMQDAIGTAPKKQFGAAPVAVTASQSAERWVVQAEVAGESLLELVRAFTQ